MFTRLPVQTQPVKEQPDLLLTPITNGNNPRFCLFAYGGLAPCIWLMTQVVSKVPYLYP